LPKLHEETDLDRLDEDPVRVLSNPGSQRLSGTATATPFVALALPMLPAHRTISHLKIGCRHPFREPLQFSVITVMSVTSPGVFGDRHVIVTVSAPKERLT
jgi:hypothetical protein